jgi:hypothetical protein
MGIYSRYSAAFLILALLTPKAFSAVRVPVIQNDEYIRQVLSRQTASTGAISTPAGQVAFFGADKVFAFSAGDSVRPTVREVKGLPNNVISFPYRPGAAYPTDPNLTPAAATKVKVKPQVVVPKANILKALKDGLKTTPVQLATTATVAAALAGVGWVMTEGSQLQKPIATPDGSKIWRLQNLNSLYSSPKTACDDLLKTKNPDQRLPSSANVQQLSLASYSCDVRFWNSGMRGVDSSFINRIANCPAGSTIDLSGSCTTATFQPVTPTDLATLDPWVSEQSAEWLGGLIRDVCNGSPNPGACYTGMVDRSKGMITGPALLAGPITTKTTQAPNADGTTSTRTETTKTDFKLTYGKDHFDVDTEKKTTVTEDGQLVSETTEKDDTPAQDVADTTPGEEQQPEPEYTFNDSPFPEITPFYEQKYPDGLSGVWNQAKADIDNSSFMRFLSSFIPSFSGSCPTFGLNFAIGNMANFGSLDFQSLCYVFDFVKIILLVTAVFAARQLTFGG